MILHERISGRTFCSLINPLHAPKATLTNSGLKPKADIAPSSPRGFPRPGASIGLAKLMGQAACFETGFSVEVAFIPVSLGSSRYVDLLLLERGAVWGLKVYKRVALFENVPSL